MRRFLALLIASAAAFSADLAGTWTLTFQTPRGERSAPVTITSKSEAIELKFAEGLPPIRGTYKDGAIEAAGKMFSVEAGREGEFKMKGAMKDGVLQGDASWEGHPMTFKAKRKE